MRFPMGSVLTTVLAIAAAAHAAEGGDVMISGARHLKVYYEEGRFAGWPANGGVWQWGDEILVGFSRGWLGDPEGETSHLIDRSRPTQRMLARSLDGGETWEVLEAPFPGGDARRFPADISFTDPGFALAAHGSVFYTSLDKGHTWHGPWQLPVSETIELRARTDYQVLGEKDLMLFLTAQKTDGHEGRPFCARTRTGGEHWNQFAWIGPEPESRFSIMPSSVRLPNGDFLVATRRRDDAVRDNHNTIELYRSQDGGMSWQLLCVPVPENGDRSGNPPSMVRLDDGRLVITYANRTAPYTVRAVFSEDDGATWSAEHIVRTNGGGWDMGYTRSVQRPDGKLVTIYYYHDTPNGERYIAATIWNAPSAR